MELDCNKSYNAMLEYGREHFHGSQERNLLHEIFLLMFEASCEGRCSIEETFHPILGEVRMSDDAVGRRIDITKVPKSREILAKDGIISFTPPDRYIFHYERLKEYCNG